MFLKSSICPSRPHSTFFYLLYACSRWLTWWTGINERLTLCLGSKNGESEDRMGRQEQIEVGDIYSPASALLDCVGWLSPSIQGHSSCRGGLPHRTLSQGSGHRFAPLPSGLRKVTALSYSQPPGNCIIFVVPPHLCKWLLY